MFKRIFKNQSVAQPSQLEGKVLQVFRYSPVKRKSDVSVQANLSPDEVELAISKMSKKRFIEVINKGDTSISDYQIKLTPQGRKAQRIYKYVTPKIKSNRKLNSQNEIDIKLKGLLD